MRITRSMRAFRWARTAPSFERGADGAAWAWRVRPVHRAAAGLGAVVAAPRPVGGELALAGGRAAGAVDRPLARLRPPCRAASAATRRRTGPCIRSIERCGLRAKIGPARAIGSAPSGRALARERRSVRRASSAVVLGPTAANGSPFWRASARGPGGAHRRRGGGRGLGSRPRLGVGRPARLGPRRRGAGQPARRGRRARRRDRLRPARGGRPGPRPGRGLDRLRRRGAAFREAWGSTAATWARGRGWALWKALTISSRRDADRRGANASWHMIAEVSRDDPRDDRRSPMETPC